MHDIVGTMFNKRFMEELFKPQDTYSKKAMRTVFDRLAHASIMRLNSASMDKVRKESITLFFLFNQFNQYLQFLLIEQQVCMGNLVKGCHYRTNAVKPNQKQYYFFDVQCFQKLLNNYFKVIFVHGLLGWTQNWGQVMGT